MSWTATQDIWVVGAIIVISTLIYGMITFYRQRLSVVKIIRRWICLAIAMLGLLILIINPHWQEQHIKESAYISTDPNAPHHYETAHELINNEKSLYDTVQMDPQLVSLQDMGLLNNYHISLQDSLSSIGILSLSKPTVILEKGPWALHGQASNQVTSIRTSIISDRWESSEVKDGAFVINSVAPPAGSYLMQLQLITDTDTSIRQIPLTVVPNEPWSLLAISSYPSFEINALKNYWTDQGNAFSWRSKVSSNTYRTTHINMEDYSLDQLTSGNLQHYNFLLIDLPSYNALTDIEKRAINKSVSNKGLGLILIPTDLGQSADNIELPSIIGYQELEDYADQRNNDIGYYTLQKQWKSLKYNTIELAQYQEYGLGRRMLLALAESHQLLLNDQGQEYNNLWKTILSAAYLQYNFQSKLLTEPWIWSGERSRLTLITTEEVSGDIILNDSMIVRHVTHPYIDNHYKLDIIAAPGYNTISFGDERLRFYAQQASSWPMIRRQLAQRFIDQRSSPSVTTSYTLSKPISRWFGVALLLLGYGLLWLDERLY